MRPSAVPTLRRPPDLGGAASRDAAPLDAPRTDATPRRRLWFGHVPIDPVDFGQALAAIAALVEAGRGGAVFTPNVDHVVCAGRDPAFRAAYADADLSLVDGAPLLWASRLVGAPLPEKISGSDLVHPLAALAARRGWRLYLLGGAPGDAAHAAQLLVERHGVEVVGVDAPLLVPGREGRAASLAALARIREARPDLLLVALGAPKQEIWIHQHRAELGAVVALGVGGALAYVAGRLRRAPRWISRAGLEWAYRLAREPRRLWRRYLVDDVAFFPLLARSWWRAQRLERQRRVQRLLTAPADPAPPEPGA